MKCVLKYGGSKWSYASWIIEHFPDHKLYLEPYFGSGAVFFKKTPASHETINDIDGMVVNFFRVIREDPEELARLIYLTPYARDEYSFIQEGKAGDEIHLTTESIENARRFAVRCCQSFGSKLSDRCGWKNTKSSSGPINPKIWGKLPETIIQAAERLKNAQIENTDAIQLIENYNTSDCLIYADPPYLGTVRNNKRMYRREMMDIESHVKLLSALIKHKGPVVLSGYDNQLYNEYLMGWHKSTKQGYSNSATPRTETIWMNYEKQLSFC